MKRLFVVLALTLACLAPIRAQDLAGVILSLNVNPTIGVTANLDKDYIPGPWFGINLLGVFTNGRVGLGFSRGGFGPEIQYIPWWRFGVMVQWNALTVSNKNIVNAESRFVAGITFNL